VSRGCVMLGRWFVQVSAVAALLGAAGPVRAESAAPSPEAEPPAASPEAAAPAVSAERFLLFSGADFWRGGGFAHGGLIWSPGGLDRDGFAVKSLLGTGTYRYQRNGASVTGLQTVASVLPGWRFVRGKFELGLFAGVDLQHHQLTPDDPDNRLRGTHVGLRAGMDLWWEPTEASMVNLAVSASTVGTGYWTRGAVGWRLFDAVYLGPEVTALGDTTYHQVRVGAHATGLRLGTWEWSAGAGWAADNDRRGGIYGRIGLLTRR
jgi:hypothetical protein